MERRLVSVDAQIKPTAAVLLRDKSREYQRLADAATNPTEAGILYAMSAVFAEVATALTSSRNDGVA